MIWINAICLYTTSKCEIFGYFPLIFVYFFAQLPLIDTLSGNDSITGTAKENQMKTLTLDQEIFDSDYDNVGFETGFDVREVTVMSRNLYVGADSILLG